MSKRRFGNACSSANCKLLVILFTNTTLILQALILEGIERDGWLANNNQAMHFGADLPAWLLACLSAKAPSFLPLLPEEVWHPRVVSLAFFWSPDSVLFGAS